MHKLSSTYMSNQIYWKAVGADNAPALHNTRFTGKISSQGLYKYLLIVSFSEVFKVFTER